MARPAMNLDAAKAYLAEYGETQMKTLASSLQVSPATLYSAVASAIARGEIVKRQDGRAVFYSLGDGTPPAANDERTSPATSADGFNAALWADGDLVLVGVELNDDGRSLTLNPKQVRLLCRLLHGQGPEA